MPGRFGGDLDVQLTAFQHFTNPVLVTIPHATGDLSAVAMGFAILAPDGDFGFLVKHPTEPGPLEFLVSRFVIWPPVLMVQTVAEASGEINPNAPHLAELNRAQRRKAGRN